MSLVTIWLNGEEEKTLNEYAKLNGISLSNLFKQVLEEKIEDEIHLKLYILSWIDRNLKGWKIYINTHPFFVRF